jgi:hypothetical protein
VKVLLDEDLPHKLRLLLTEHEVFTVAYMGWGGLKNGALLRAAENGGFDVLVTGDQSMPYEQNLPGRKLGVIALSATELYMLQPHIGKISAAIDVAKAGTVTRVDVGLFSRPKRAPGPALG